MTLKKILFGEDETMDRDDPLFWLAFIGIAVFLGAEAHGKITRGEDISEMAYVLLIATSLGRAAIKNWFGVKTREASKKEGYAHKKSTSIETINNSTEIDGVDKK